MVNIAVSVPTLTGRLLDRCLASVFAQREVGLDVYVIRNAAPAEAVCAEWEKKGVYICRPGYNVGVAGSWNFSCGVAWERGHDAITILNDDIQLLDPLTLDEFRRAASADPKRMLVMGQGWSAFCWTRTLWDALGPWDEGYWPAYWEDLDMARRLQLAGIPIVGINKFCHHEGSDTIHNGGEAVKKLHVDTFCHNEKRYFTKWGGGFGKEQFTVPWNGGTALPSTKDLVKP